ncbi:dirigent protein 25-like [Cornus florida]|uniref:dirigent protein 25-like n=1 Tax=Cornus florida TaxID=4283 RepID=UPI0028A2B8F1|nr:dirigent protein 25-like [Cornus florida]
MPTIAWFLLFFTSINQSFSARTLGDHPSPTHHHRRDHVHHPITFYMQDVVRESHPSLIPAATKVNSLLPFSKPLGLFPPYGGIPLTDPNPTVSASGFSTQTLDLQGISISFPAISTLQELEFGTVTGIDSELFEGSVFGSRLLGKAQGMYVASSEDGSSHMMAMTTTYAESEYKDALRFFGVHRADVAESHVAVIGGTGKYQNANGYATIRTVNVSSTAAGKESEGANKLLHFNVYLG